LLIWTGSVTQAGQPVCIVACRHEFSKLFTTIVNLHSKYTRAVTLENGVQPRVS
jgi:hypothetical protein